MQKKTKSKSLFKRITALAVTLVTAFSMLSTTIASAVSVKTPEKHLSGWGYDFRNSKVTSNAYDPVTKGYTNANFRSVNGHYCRNYLAYWVDTNGNYCYCVQHGTKHYDNITSEIEDLLKTTRYPEKMRKTLGYATIYAYKGTTKYGYTYDVELAASQVIIWNISAAYFDDTTTGIKANSNEQYVLDCIIAPSSTKKSQFVECYKKMKADILGHLTIPKGTYASEDKARANKYTLKINPSNSRWETTIASDSNMACFDVTTNVSGVTFTKNGNNLKVSATNEGAKALANLTDAVELKKNRAVSGHTIEECMPVYLSASSSQDKISYSLKKDDPVKAYVAFEIATTDLEVHKKINENGTLINATDYEYTYLDADLGTEVKVTWDKSYIKNTETGEWEYRNGVGLRSIVRFKLRTYDNKYIKFKRISEREGGVYEFVGFVDTKDEGTEMVLSYGHGNVGDAPAGTTIIKALPAMAPYPYIVEEYHNPNHVSSFAEVGLTSSNATASLSAGTKGVANLVNKLVVNGDLTINKIISLADNAEPTDEMYNAVSFWLKDSNGQYLTLNQVNAETGAYGYVGTTANESDATTIKLGTTTHTANVSGLPLGAYVVIENVDDKFEATSNNLDTTVSSDDESTITFFNVEKTGTIKVVKRTEGNLNVEGIGFTLSGTSASGRAISQYGTTDANGELTFEKIPIGRYTITEDGNTVPYAYLVANEQSVEVVYNETTEAEFYNKEKTGMVKTVKTTEGQKNISGIEFRLTGISDSTRNIYAKAITGADGTAMMYQTDSTFENYLLGDNGEKISAIPIGTYKIMEIASSVDETVYITAESQDVSVLYNETTTSTFENDEKKGVVTIIKHTEGDLNIANIEFRLSGPSKSGREIYAKGVTDIDGKATLYLTDSTFENYLLDDEGNPIDDIPVGTYTISEVAETVDEDVYFVADEQNASITYNMTTTKTFFNAEKTGKVETVKVTEGQKNISGIVFRLSGTSKSGRDIYAQAVTGANGKGILYLTDSTFENYLLDDEGNPIDDIPVGTYTISEIASSVNEDIYLTAESQDVSVFFNQTTTSIFQNKERTGAIKVVKRTEGNFNISGIGFKLTGTSDSGREIYAYGITDVNGKADLYITDANGEYILDDEGNKIRNIPIGIYTITEDGSTVPYAYLVAESQEVRVEYAETTEKIFYNMEKHGTIKVVKRTEGDLNVEGIGFTLSGTSDSGRSISKYGTTDEKGELTFEGIPVGTYTITEDGSTVPYAYLVAEPQSVDVTYNQTVTKKFDNLEKYGTIKVVKRTEGNFNISGIGFTLSGTSDSGREINEYGTTDETGSLTFTVPIGTYTITEDGSTVHYAYLVAEPQSVTVTYSSEVTKEIYNAERTGYLEIQKETYGMKNLEDIGFTLKGKSDSGREIYAYGITNKDGNADFFITDDKGEYILDENGNKIRNIPIGTYTIHEDKATVPFGYAVAEPTDVTIVYAKTSLETVVNEGTGTLSLTKTDVSTGKLIPNCEIAIYNENGNVVVSGTTDENGVIEFELSEGVYYYQEIKAPSGYLIDNSKYRFEILAGEIVKATMTNEKIPEEDTPPDTGDSPVKDVPGTLLGIILLLGVICVLLKKKINAN